MRSNKKHDAGELCSPLVAMWAIVWRGTGVQGREKGSEGCGKSLEVVRPT